jgi:hypothetical protein
VLRCIEDWLAGALSARTADPLLMMRWLLLCSWPAAAPASAGETVSVCYNYGCLAESEVHYSDAATGAGAGPAWQRRSAADEREKLSLAIGWLLGWAGQQTPIAADRGGNTADDGVYGRMDCIDHSTTTTRLLRLLEARGWLRFHRVLEPVRRVRYLFAVHYSAQIEEIAGDGGRHCCGEAQRMRRRAGALCRR